MTCGRINALCYNLIHLLPAWRNFAHSHTVSYSVQTAGEADQCPPAPGDEAVLSRSVASSRPRRFHASSLVAIVCFPRHRTAAKPNQRRVPLDFPQTRLCMRYRLSSPVVGSISTTPAMPPEPRDDLASWSLRWLPLNRLRMSSWRQQSPQTEWHRHGANTHHALLAVRVARHEVLTLHGQLCRVPETFRW